MGDALAAASAPLVQGHWKALERLENIEAYGQTRELYRRELEGIEVYLRPTGKGFTVISLDEKAPKMIGVGGTRSGDCRITALPPKPERVRKQTSSYWPKRDAARHSAEERYSIALVRTALAGDLSFGPAGLYFIHQEWRFGSTSTRIDILAADPTAGQLVVLELKDNEPTARANDSAKGGDAWHQARHYASLLHARREDYYPYFQRLTRVLARAHNAPDNLKSITLNPHLPPRTLVGWPGGHFEE